MLKLIEYISIKYRKIVIIAKNLDVIFFKNFFFKLHVMFFLLYGYNWLANIILSFQNAQMVITELDVRHVPYNVLNQDVASFQAHSNVPMGVLQDIEE